MGKIGGLIDGRHQKGKGSVSRAAFDSEYFAYRSQVERISTQSVKRVGRKGHDLAGNYHMHSVFQQESKSCLVYFNEFSHVLCRASAFWQELGNRPSCNISWGDLARLELAGTHQECPYFPGAEASCAPLWQGPLQLMPQPVKGSRLTLT
jgi:hypothetical protein